MENPCFPNPSDPGTNSPQPQLAGPPQAAKKHLRAVREPLASKEGSGNDGQWKRWDAYPTRGSVRIRGPSENPTFLLPAAPNTSRWPELARPRQAIRKHLRAVREPIFQGQQSASNGILRPAMAGRRASPPSGGAIGRSQHLALAGAGWASPGKVGTPASCPRATRRMRRRVGVTGNRGNQGANRDGVMSESGETENMGFSMKIVNFQNSDFLESGRLGFAILLRVLERRPPEKARF